MNVTQCRELIKEVLLELDPKFYSANAEELLLGTMAVESNFGYHLWQIPNGPGSGYFSIEPATEASIWNHYLKYRPELAERVTSITGISGPTPKALIRRLDYQIIMARLKYRTCPGKIPSSLLERARYWDTYYNGNPYYGTVEDYVGKYNKYCR